MLTLRNLKKKLNRKIDELVLDVAMSMTNSYKMELFTKYYRKALQEMKQLNYLKLVKHKFQDLWLRIKKMLS